MEQIAVDAFTPAVRADILNRLKVEADDLAELDGFESYLFERKSNNSIVRIRHISHRDEEQIRAELEFVHYLANQGAAFGKPIALSGGNLVVCFDEFLICQFRVSSGKHQVTP